MNTKLINSKTLKARIRLRRAHDEILRRGATMKDAIIKHGADYADLKMLIDNHDRRNLRKLDAIQD